LGNILRGYRLLIGLLLLFGPVSHAGATGHNLTHYKHTAWTPEDGAPGDVQAIVQDRNGYLWLGGPNLTRFDGLIFDTVPRAKTMKSQSSGVYRLFVDTGGRLWAGHDIGGVSIFKNGEMTDANFGTNLGSVFQFVQDKSGAVWAMSDGAAFAQLHRYIRGRWETPHDRWGLPLDHAQSMAVDSDGTLWLASDHVLLFLRAGATHFEATHETVSTWATITTAPDRSLLIEDSLSVRRMRYLGNGRYAPSTILYAFSGGPRPVGFSSDSSGNIWSAIPSLGVLKIAAPAKELAPGANPRIEIFSDSRLTAATIISQAVDREGNLWFATAKGIERFSPSDLTTNIFDPGVSPKSESPVFDFAVLANSSGDIFVNDMRRIYQVKPRGDPTLVSPLDMQRNTWCSARKGGVWATEKGSIVGPDLASPKQIALPAPIAAAAYMQTCLEDSHGRLWVSSSGGTAWWDGSSWHDVMLKNTVKRGPARFIVEDQQGHILAYIPGGPLVRIDSESPQIVIQAKQNPVQFTYVMARSGSAIYIGGERGLARLKDGRIQVLTSQQYPFLDAVDGFLQNKRGQTWLIATSGLLLLNTRNLDAAFEHPGIPLAHREFNAEDGFSGGGFGTGGNELIEGGDGRIWIATTDGISWIDPAHLLHNALPPPVEIKTVAIDSNPNPVGQKITLQSGASNLEIDYAALSLIDAKRNRYLYKLDGFDKGWTNAGARRQAFYTGLGPGNYRFQVIASNNNGVWNSAGASMAIEILPTFWQSVAFRILFGLAAAAALWALYAFRLNQVSRRLHEQMEERVIERERIARELHDTLLQSVQGLILRFQSVLDRMPRDQVTRDAMLKVLERADQVLIEGRNRVRDLRGISSTLELREVFAATASDIVMPEAVFEIRVAGELRTLHSVAGEEIMRIGNEAIFNAFRHARASRIEVDIDYQRSQLALTIRDNGIGISDEVLKQGGRDGHFGIVGMQERARRINAALSVTNRTAGGTKISLSVPAIIAYAQSKRGIIFSLRRLFVAEA
jgi:signal transduction histidine kinase/ligand-binding sensor domain-containing protein